MRCSSAGSFACRLWMACGWRMVGAPDRLAPGMAQGERPRMARASPAHRPSATRMHSMVRLRSGMDVETAMFNRGTTHPSDNTQCVGSREAGSAFRCTVDTRHQAEVAACYTGPSRAIRRSSYYRFGRQRPRPSVERIRLLANDTALRNYDAICPRAHSTTGYPAAFRSA